MLVSPRAFHKESSFNEELRTAHKTQHERTLSQQSCAVQPALSLRSSSQVLSRPAVDARTFATVHSSVKRPIGSLARLSALPKPLLNNHQVLRAPPTSLPQSPSHIRPRVSFLHYPRLSTISSVSVVNSPPIIIPKVTSSISSSTHTAFMWPTKSSASTNIPTSS